MLKTSLAALHPTLVPCQNSGLDLLLLRLHLVERLLDQLLVSELQTHNSSSTWETLETLETLETPVL